MVVDVDRQVGLEAETDEDVLVVFAGSSCWVLACESSILVVGEDGERQSTLELDDTIEACTFDGSKLYARLSNGNERIAEVSSDGLRLV